MNPKKTAIIFGSSGQDGYYLSKLLLKHKVNVVGVSRSSGDIIGSVSNIKLVSDILNKLRPDYIFHLAAKSSTKNEYNVTNFNSIEVGTFNILESVRQKGLNSKIFISGSAYQFKNLNEPIHENTELSSDNFYSFARNQSLELSRFYRKEYGLKVYFGFLFNHDSPRRSDNFFCQKMLKLAHSCKNKNTSNKIHIGDLSYRREYSFAGDIMEAVFTFVMQDRVHEVVIGSGIAFSLKEWVFKCFEKYGLNCHDFIEYEFADSKKTLVSSPKLIKSLGWVPDNDFKSLLSMMWK